MGWLLMVNTAYVDGKAVRSTVTCNKIGKGKTKHEVLQDIGGIQPLSKTLDGGKWVVDMVPIIIIGDDSNNVYNPLT